MRLSRFTDICLRALMYLGAHPDRLVPTTEMSERLHVSREHLMKCLRALADFNLVEGVRGQGGGFRLTGDGDEIRLGDLVRRTEPTLAMAECFEPVSHCPLTGRCRLAGVLAESQKAFFTTMDRYTLGDLLAADRHTLIQLEGPGE